MLTNRFSYLDIAGYGDDILHPEHVEYSPLYMRIRDCLDSRIKEKGSVYLPDPSEGVHDKELRELRYKNYLQRACFVPVTRRTRDGLVAQVLMRKPKVQSPEDRNNLLQRISARGNSILSLANVALAENVAFGRGAFVVTYAANADRPFIDFVQTEDIITWAELPYGMVDDIGRNVGSITVRKFFDTLGSDGVSVTKVAQLTQYTLSNQGVVWVRRKHSSLGPASTSNNTKWTNYELLRVKGEAVRHIPVFPQGCEDNDIAIQTPPLGELADLNLSYYVNSADYEEFAKLAGQVTPVFSGLKSDWYTKHIEGKVMFGMRTPVGLNEGATAQLLQAQPNSVAKEMLDKKEAQMVAVGARLIEERKIRRTATEASLEDQSYHSILGHIASNTSEAFNQALNFFGKYYGLPEGALTIRLNDDFSTISSDAEHRRLLLEEYVAGVRTFEEYRNALRNYDATLGDDDESAKKTIITEAKSFKKVLAESTMQKPQAAGEMKQDNRTKSKQPSKED